MPGDRSAGPVEPDELRDPRLESDAATARSMELDSLFQRIAAETVDTPPSGMEKMRRLPTSWRRLAAGLVLLGVGCAMVLKQGLRPDLSEQALRLAPLIGLSLGAVLLGLFQALRPLHRPPPRLPWLLPSLLLGLGLLSVLAGGWPGQPSAPEPSIHLGCALATGLGALSLALGTIAFDRGAGAASWRIVTASMASALGAFAIQALVCPIVELAHLGGAHGGPGLLVAAALWLVFGVRRAQ